MGRRLRLAIAAATVGFATAVAPAAAGAPATTVLPPPVNGTFDYQIGGAYPPAADVDIVDRDRHAQPDPDRYSICYVNAFQTQPGTVSWWKRHHPALLLRDGSGALVEDRGWPGEYLLDTSTAHRRNRLAAVVGGWIGGCASKGFEGVEPDNLDSFTRSHGLLTRDDNLSYAALLAATAHADGLAIAQKNLAGGSATAKQDVGFDFAIAEECQVYSECRSYLDAYGDHVVEIEYTDNGKRYFTAACNARGSQISVVLRDRNVVPPSNSHYVEQWC